MRLGQGPTPTRGVPPSTPAAAIRRKCAHQKQVQASIQGGQATGSGQAPDEGLVFTKCGREQSAPRDVEHPLLSEHVSGTLSAN